MDAVLPLVERNRSAARIVIYRTMPATPHKLALINARPGRGLGGKQREPTPSGCAFKVAVDWFTWMRCGASGRGKDGRVGTRGETNGSAGGVRQHSSGFAWSCGAVPAIAPKKKNRAMRALGAEDVGWQRLSGLRASRRSVLRLENGLDRVAKFDLRLETGVWRRICAGVFRHAVRS